MESLLSQLQYLKYEAFHFTCGLKPLIFKNSKSNHRKSNPNYSTKLSKFRGTIAEI